MPYLLDPQRRTSIASMSLLPTHNPLISQMSADSPGSPGSYNIPQPGFSQRWFPGTASQGNDQGKDIANRIPRLYRILDLISEQGSGGLGEPAHST